MTFKGENKGGHDTHGHAPFVATDFKYIASQLPLADLREVFDLPSELPIKISWDRA
jgi:hypothetical protein